MNTRVAYYNIISYIILYYTNILNPLVRGGRVVVGARPFGHGRDRNRKRRHRRRRGPVGSHAHIRRPSVRPSDVRRLFKFNRYITLLLWSFHLSRARCRFKKKKYPSPDTSSEKQAQTKSRKNSFFSSFTRLNRVYTRYYIHYYDIPLLSARGSQ